MARQHPEALVIGADTIVVVGDMILGKPLDPDQARDYLLLLQGRTHDVFTGYTIVLGDRAESRVIRTRVRFRPMTHEEIVWYIASGEPMDKAGAYALQGIASIFITGIRGSHQCHRVPSRSSMTPETVRAWFEALKEEVRLMKSMY